MKRACRFECYAVIRRRHGGMEKLAGATGLEPAASCVTGRRSNQLNYVPALPISYNYRPFLSVPVASLKFPRMP